MMCFFFAQGIPFFPRMPEQKSKKKKIWRGQYPLSRYKPKLVLIISLPIQ